MKKLALNLSDLRVESFSTTPTPQERGTVRANDDSGEGTFLNETCGQWSCQQTCANTCAETCPNTCDKGNTGPCDWTCQGYGHTCYQTCATGPCGQPSISCGPEAECEFMVTPVFVCPG